MSRTELYKILEEIINELAASNPMISTFRPMLLSYAASALNYITDEQADNVIGSLRKTLCKVARRE
ncbi:MAG: hypothetical protein ACP5IE_06765 [Infirmifilum sp.]